MLTRWAVHLLPSNCRKPFTSKAHGKVSLTQLTAIEAPTKTEGWQSRTIVLRTAWTSYEICAPTVDQMVLWLCRLRYHNTVASISGGYCKVFGFFRSGSI
jgi:hypothetical protein